MLTLFLAFREHEAKWSRNILWLFVAYFASNISRVDESWDISRYIDRFEETHKINQSFTGFIKEVSEISPDFIQPLINFLVSKISGNFRVLLIFYGLLYGFFYSRNIFTLIEFLRGYLNRPSILLVLSLSFLMGIMEFNGIRYNTAAHMLVYGMVQYYIRQKKSLGFIIVLITPLMHFSYVGFVAFFLINVFIVRKKLWIGMVFFIVSNFASNFGIDNLIPKEALPQTYQAKVNGYVGKERVDEAKLQQSSMNLNAYVEWPLQFNVWYFTFCILLIYFQIINNKHQFKNPELLSMVFLFGGLGKIAESASSTGGRLVVVSYMLFGLYLVYIYKDLLEFKYFKIFVNNYTWLFILSFIVNIRRIFDFMGFATFFGGPIVRLFFNEDIPIIDGFKTFFPSF